MRTLLTLALALVLAIVAVPTAALACGPDNVPAERAAQPAQKGDHQTLVAITGMTCGACAEGIAKILSNIEGVRSAVVNLDKENATIVYNPAAVKVTDIVRAVEKAGYGATKVEDKQV